MEKYLSYDGGVAFMSLLKVPLVATSVCDNDCVYIIEHDDLG